jgi:hypothetical protein
MSIFYATFDQSIMGASLALSNADQVVTTTLPGLTIHRLVQATISLEFFSGNVEWLPFGTASLSTSNFAVGITDGTTPTTKYVGEDTHSYGLKSDGNLYFNNASVASSGTTIADNDIVGMVYNPIDPSLTFYKNGVLILTYTIGSSFGGTGPWFPAASLGSTATGDLSIFMNAGQQSFQFPLPGLSGWWDQTAQINPVRVATEDFTSLPTDTVANAVWDGVVDPVSNNGQNLKIVRGVSPWPWRKNTSSLSGGQSYGSVTLDDPFERYGNLLSTDVRDAIFTIQRTPSQQSGGSVDTAQVIATCVVERVDTAGDYQKTVYVKDVLATFDIAMQRSLFLPNVLSSAVGQPLPVVIGAARSVPGVLINSTAPYTLQFTDMPIAQLGGPRIAGRLAVAGLDFNLTADARSCAFDATLYPDGPQGKIIADISAVGGSVIGLTDLLVTQPANYTGTAAGTNTYTTTASPVPAGYVSGEIYRITFTNANSGASTLNANSLGAKAIQLDGIAVTSGQIPAGSVLDLRYNGTNFQIVGSSLGWVFNTYTTTDDLARNATRGGYFSNKPNWVGSGTDPTYPYPRLEMEPQGGAGIGSWVSTKWNMCRNGYTYIAEVAIEHIPAQDIYATQAAYLFAGLVQSYHASSGQVAVFNPYFVNYGIDAYGSPTIRMQVTNTTGSSKPFVLGFQSNNITGTHGLGLGKIKSVKLYELPLASSVVNLTGTNLQTFLQTVIETEGGLSPAAWSSADAAAIDILTGYTSLGNYYAQSITVRNACQPALDSCGCDFFPDRSGVVRVFRLVDPGTITSSGIIDESVILGAVSGGSVEAGLTIGSSQNSMIAMSQDMAPGLTTKAGARFNQSQSSQGDFGATTLADCPNETRALLTQPYQAVVASGVQLSNAYRYAQQAAPLRTCFDDPAEALIEIERINALYTQLRFFYYVPVKSDFSDSYEIGQAWQLKYPRYDLSGGKDVLIVGIAENPITEQLTLVCWG